ncbi:MAG: DUF4199 domain-containing protein [Candidatus Eisenbacteria bacterium]|uniref:DUF4199 domain-containing protein n=1 Tax=Eiseniibacteriota bacterium TaxID=2212470 RepID=A0A849SJJ0_UNCEI|nr:DUF4199 domain-containing protein [Candidatus Eisenbacteria bacterium]
MKNPAVKWGLILGGLGTAWAVVMMSTGWSTDPVMANLAWVNLLFTIIVMISAMRETAAQGKSYGGQVGTGFVVALVSGLVGAIASYILTAFVFPNFLSEVLAMQEEAMRAKGTLEEAQIQQAMEGMAFMFTPPVNAAVGFIFSVCIGTLIALPIAAFVRAKK